MHFRFCSGDLVRLCVTGMHHPVGYICIFISFDHGDRIMWVINGVGAVEWFYTDELEPL